MKPKLTFELNSKIPTTFSYEGSYLITEAALDVTHVYKPTNCRSGNLPQKNAFDRTWKQSKPQCSLGLKATSTHQGHDKNLNSLSAVYKFRQKEVNLQKQRQKVFFKHPLKCDSPNVGLQFELKTEVLFNNSYHVNFYMGERGSPVVKVLCYKSEGR